ncbi:hypothetical protein Tco_0930147 [Tanacetum coccineum]
MSSEDCSECPYSGSDLCIEESAPASLVSVICHPVEVRAGCCLVADASDSLGFFELWSSSFGRGRDVVIVVASVLIGGGVTSNDGLEDETSMKGAITGGVDVTV